MAALTDAQAAGSPKSLNGRPLRYSASAGDLFASCQMKWFLQNVMENPSPPDPTLLFGTAVHYVLESWLKGGIIIPPGGYKVGRDSFEVDNNTLARAKTAVRHLPPPGTGKVEQDIPSVAIASTDGKTIWSTGKADWFGLDEPWTKGLRPFSRSAVRLHVLDHKTKGRKDGSFGVPTPDDLNKNHQGRFYAWTQAVALLGKVEDTAFTHNYIIKAGTPETVPVHTIFSADALLEEAARAEALGKGMIQVAEKRDTKDIPFNKNFCRAFGKECHLARICPAHAASTTSLQGAFRAYDAHTPKDNAMSIWDDLDDTPTPPSKPENKAPPAAKAEPPADEAPADLPKGDINAPDAAPHDVDHVAPEFVKDVAEVVKATFEAQNPAGVVNRPWNLSTVASICAREGLPPAFTRNVAFLSGIPLTDAEALAPLVGRAREDVLSIPADLLEAGLTGTVAERAKNLLAMPLRVFQNIAEETPFEVVVAARAACGETRRAAILDGIIDRAHVTTPFDGETPLDKVKRKVYLRAVSGQMPSDDEVDEWLKENGVYKRRSATVIADVVLGVQAILKKDGPAASTNVEHETVVEKAPQRAENPVLKAKSVDDLLGLLAGDDRDGSVRAHAKRIVQEHVGALLVAGDVAQPEPKVVERVVEKVVEKVVHVGGASAPFTFYAGCRPLDGNVQHIAQYLKPVVAATNAKVALEQKGCPDWNLAEYGMGKKIFVDTLRRHLINNPLPSGETYWMPRNSEFSDIPLVEMLSEAGATVVVGLSG